MNFRLIKTFFIAFLVFASKLMAGGSSGTTGQILELRSNEQIRIMMLDSFDYQNALDAVKLSQPLEIVSTDSQSTTADSFVWPQGINIHSGLPFIRSLDANEEEIFLLNIDLGADKIEPTEDGYKFTDDWQNVAMGGSSGTTGSIAEALAVFYGIDTATVNTETFESIYDLIQDQSENNALVNIENSYQFLPQRVLKVDNIPVIEGIDDTGKYLYLFGKNSAD
ncbi:MAG: hypothetical protein KBD78_11615 [Oligoflexales bacterium]|nr:hypothetical protein [Oligoflexales bacterium]